MSKHEHKNKLKLAIVLIIIIILSGGALLFLPNGNKEIKDSLEGKIKAYETDMEDSEATLTSTEKIRDYLISWAENKGIEYHYTKDNNVIMHRPASEGHETDLPTVIVCDFNENYIKGSVKPFAMAFSILKSKEDYGDLNVIFANNQNGDFEGIKALGEKYFPDSANVISLNKGTKHMISSNSGGASSYEFSKLYTPEEPKDNTSYIITLSGTNGGIPDTKLSSYPNPVAQLGTFLAKLQASSMIFQLSNFSGGTGPNTYPTSATATIVINSGDVDKFQGKIDTLSENLKEDFKKEFPDISLSFQPTEMPKNVLDKDISTHLLSLMYTLTNGVYYKDNDGNVISISGINFISTDGGKVSVKTLANSLSIPILSEMDNAQETLAGLSEFTFEKTGEVPLWSSDPEGEFAKKIINSYRRFNGKSIDFTPSVPPTNCSYIQEKNSNLKLISITSDDETSLKDAGAILTFLISYNR